MNYTYAIYIIWLKHYHSVLLNTEKKYLLPLDTRTNNNIF